MVGAATAHACIETESHRAAADRWHCQNAHCTACNEWSEPCGGWWVQSFSLWGLVCRIAALKGRQKTHLNGVNELGLCFLPLLTSYQYYLPYWWVLMGITDQDIGFLKVCGNWCLMTVSDWCFLTWFDYSEYWLICQLFWQHYDARDYVI